MSGTTVKAEHVNPFILATMEMFTKMMKVEVAPGKIALKKDARLSYDISGVIGLSGGARGTVALCFPKEVAVKAANRFMQSDYADLGEEVASAIGELANIVAGRAKQGLEQFKISISLPSVILGQSHRILEPKDALSFVIPFECELGKFELTVSLKSVA